MPDGVEIRGGASADETAAILAAIALVLEAELASQAPHQSRRIPPWVRLGRLAQPTPIRQGRLPSTYADPLSG